MAVGWWSNCPSLTGFPLLHASKCITCFYHTMFKSIPDSFRNCSASQTPQAGTEPAHKLRQKQQPQNNTKKTTQKSQPHKSESVLASQATTPETTPAPWISILPLWNHPKTIPVNNSYIIYLGALPHKPFHLRKSKRQNCLSLVPIPQAVQHPNSGCNLCYSLNYNTEIIY